jgi:hypothetical protein
MTGLPLPRTVIIDNFYDDPESIRQMALSLPYRRKPLATYPGREAVAPGFDWSDARARLASNIPEDVSGPCTKKEPFPQGKFRVALASDEETRRDGVHEDVQPWSGVIYLSQERDCRGHGAIGFYRHRETGATASTPDWWLFVSLKLEFANLTEMERADRFWAYMRDKTQWEEIARVDNVYNRAVLLYARCFHASIGLFGATPQVGRLTQHFEFYYPETSIQ